MVYRLFSHDVFQKYLSYPLTHGKRLNFFCVSGLYGDVDVFRVMTSRSGLLHAMFIVIGTVVESLARRDVTCDLSSIKQTQQ